MDLTINVHARKIIKTLGYFAIGFLIAGIVSHTLKYSFNTSPGLYRWFNVDGEKNFPALFSGGLLLLSAALLCLISIYKRKQKETFALHWSSLSCIFALLTVDELFSFHERLSDVVKAVLPTSGVFHFAWIIVGMLFLLGMGLGYWRFLINLPNRYRRLFLAAATLFIIGAIGMEMLGGYYVENHQQWNRNVWLALTTVEEGLEMFGLITFIYALLSYVKDFVGSVHVRVDNRTNNGARSAAPSVDLRATTSEAHH